MRGREGEVGVGKRLFGTAAILAGGRSERMLGLDKQTISLGGERLAERQIRALCAHFEEIIVVTYRPELYAYPGIRIVTDFLPGFGPLSGLHAALRASSAEWVFLTACDMPGFDPLFMKDCMRRIMETKEARACVAAYRDHFEPFHAFYSTSLLSEIEALCAAYPVRDPESEGRGERSAAIPPPENTGSLESRGRRGRRAGSGAPSIGNLLARVSHLRIPEEEARGYTPDWKLFYNINTREELASFIAGKSPG